MVNNNDGWSALSLKDRADLMNMYITNGISDLKEMKRHYNSFNLGGNIDGDEDDMVYGTEDGTELDSAVVSASKSPRKHFDSYINIDESNVEHIKNNANYWWKNSDEYQNAVHNAYAEDVNKMLPFFEGLKGGKYNDVYDKFVEEFISNKKTDRNPMFYNPYEYGTEENAEFSSLLFDYKLNNDMLSWDSSAAAKIINSEAPKDFNHEAEYNRHIKDNVTSAVGYIGDLYESKKAKRAIRRANKYALRKGAPEHFTHFSDLDKITLNNSLMGSENYMKGNTISLDTNVVPYDYDTTLRGTLAHEAAHSRLLYNSKNTRKLLDNPELVSEIVDNSPYYGFDYGYIRPKHRKWLDVKNPINDHDFELAESYSDLMGLRMKMHDAGIIDGTKQRYKNKHIKEYMNTLGMEDRYISLHPNIRHVRKALNRVWKNGGEINRFDTGGDVDKSKSAVKTVDKTTEFMRNVLRTPTRIVLGEIMDIAQLFQYGPEHAWDRIKSKNWDSQSRKEKQNYFKNEYDDPSQTAYLFNKRDHERAMLNSGYIKGVPGDYGLVKHAVGDRDLPVFQKQQDDAYVGNLKVIGNISDNFYGREGLEHSGHFPTAIYIDDAGNIFQKAWDLHDYGIDTSENSGVDYSEFGTQKIANLLDKIGNPIVRTTGLQKLDKEGVNSILYNFKGNEELVNFILDNSVFGEQFKYDNRVSNIYNEYSAYIRDLVSKDKDYTEGMKFDAVDALREKYKKIHPFKSYLQSNYPELAENPWYSEIPGIKYYKDGGHYKKNYNSFSGEEDTPERFISKEEYLDKQRQAIIDKSIETSSTRILPTVPYVAKYANEEEWRRAMLDRLATFQSRIEYLEKNSTVDNDNENSLSYWKDLKKTIEEEFNKGFTNPLCAGASCIYTATDNYGKKYRVSSNRAFRSNPEKYGFTEIGLNEIKSGDIIQDFEWHNHEPYHAVTFIGYDDNNRAIFNYSKGGENEETIVKEGHYPFFWDNTTNVHLDGINNDKLRDNAAAYRFIGNKEDNDKWNSEYLKYRQNYENNWLDTAKQVIWNEAPKILVDNPYSKTILSGEEDTNNSTAVEFIKNTIQFPKRLVKGELMDLAQLFQHGFTGGKPFIIYDRIYLDDYYDISESFRGNPYITPAILTDTNAFMETE